MNNRLTCHTSKTKLNHHVAATGFTLIELIMAIVIIAFGLAGILSVMDSVARTSADPMLQTQAQAIAQSYLEEILLRSYCDDAADPPCAVVCPPPEITRDQYDNICDYNGLTDVGARDQNGNAIAGLADYTVQVAIATNATLYDLIGSNEVLLIQVSVQHTAIGTFSLVGYRGAY